MCGTACRSVGTAQTARLLTAAHKSLVNTQCYGGRPLAGVDDRCEAPRGVPEYLPTCFQPLGLQRALEIAEQIEGAEIEFAAALKRQGQPALSSGATPRVADAKPTRGECKGRISPEGWEHLVAARARWARLKHSSAVQLRGVGVHCRLLVSAEAPPLRSKRRSRHNSPAARPCGHLFRFSLLTSAAPLLRRWAYGFFFRKKKPGAFLCLLLLRLSWKRRQFGAAPRFGFAENDLTHPCCLPVRWLFAFPYARKLPGAGGFPECFECRAAECDGARRKAEISSPAPAKSSAERKAYGTKRLVPSCFSKAIPNEDCGASS